MYCCNASRSVTEPHTRIVIIVEGFGASKMHRLLSCDWEQDPRGKERGNSVSEVDADDETDRQMVR